MALIEMNIDDVIKAMNGADIMDTDTESEMLFVGGEILAQQVRTEMARSHYNLSQLLDNVKCKRKIKTGKDGNRFVVVSVYGKNSRGVPNSVVAFVLNYGRLKRYGEIVGEHYWNRASEAAQNKAANAVRSIAEKKLKEKGLI